MVYELNQYKKIADEMIQYDRQRDKANVAYDLMDHTDWDLPKELSALWWVRAVPVTQPHDAIASGVRVLSALDERVKWQPVAGNQQTKEQYNEWERVLKWLMAQANKRVHGTVQRSVVRSAIKYDEVIAQVIDLDYQIEQKKIFKGDASREKAARKMGRFATVVYHPSDVHVQYSTWMPEAVLLCQQRSALEVWAEWGELAEGMTKTIDQGNGYGKTMLDLGKVAYYDYSDYSSRCIWVEPRDGQGNMVEIMREENKLPFLNWVARVGGDVMEHDPEHRRNPLLYPVYTSDSWDTLNVINSIVTSEVIARGAAGRGKEEGPVEDSSTVTTYGDVEAILKVTPGNTYQQLQPPPLDTALAAIADRMGGEMTRATLSNILAGGDLPSGTSFAALNLATQTAIGALKPYKELAERALADVYSMFLLWAFYTKKNIEGYGMDKKNAGAQYSIPWDAIDPEQIYLTVELAPDVPLDRQQRANTAMMLVQSNIYSKERALEDMGVTDPEAEQEQIYQEQIEQELVAQVIGDMRFEQQMKQQQQMLMLQQAMQPPPPEEQGMPPEMMGGMGGGMPPGMENIQNEMAGAPGGMAWNPAMGGMPPAMGAPSATREQVSGVDEFGNEVMV